MRGQLADRVRRQQPARVLEVEPVHLLTAGERRGALGVVLVRMDLADRVREPDHDLLDPLGPRDRREVAQTPGIIGRVGNLKAPDPVTGHEPEREAHHLLVGRHPGDEAHPGRDHPERRLGHRLADQPDPLPRVLAVEAHRDRHVRARGEVERVVADPVERRRDRQHVGRRQPGRAPQALVAVASGRVDELDHSVSPPCSQSVVDRRAARTRGGRARREQRPVCLHALDVEPLERLEQDVDRLLAIVAVRDQLCHQRVVVRRDLAPGEAVRVDTQPRQLGDGEDRQPARARHEPLGRRPRRSAGTRPRARKASRRAGRSRAARRRRSRAAAQPGRGR